MRAIVLSACLSLAAPAFAETITIRADEWFPVNGVPKSDKEGFQIDLARTIFEAKGHTVDYQTMPWERAVKATQDGEIDCVVGTYNTTEKLVYPTENWGMDEVYFYVKADNPWTFTGMDSLKGLKLGLIGAYEYSKELNALIESNPSQFQLLSTANALEQNIKKVIAGRVDATAESRLIMPPKMAALGVEGQLKEAGRLADPTPLFIGCSAAKPSSAAYVKLVDEAMPELRANGKLKAILDKYGLADWK